MLCWAMLGAILGVAALLVPCPAFAVDVAVLRNGFTIRHDHRIVMGETTRLFLSADDASFTDVATSQIAGFEQDLTALPPPPAAQAPTSAFPATAPAPSFPATGPVAHRSFAPAVDLNQVVNSASAEYHLDPDLVNSVIRAESRFNARAVSPKGAQGLMQLMPKTANELGVNNAFDPEQNVGGGSRYLRELIERYNFDLVKALAAYNAGPERVEQYKGVPPFRETRAYVARIVHDYNQKKIAQEKAAAQARKQSEGQSTKTDAAKPASGSPASQKQSTHKQTAHSASHATKPPAPRTKSSKNNAPNAASSPSDNTPR